MGSLMAGWASRVRDPDRVRLERNRSFTKEEIAAFRRLHKRKQEDVEGNDSSNIISKERVVDRMLKKPALGHRLLSESPPIAEKGGVPHPHRIVDWWTRSTWAFLNEPPRDQMNDFAYKYTPQFRIA